MIRNYEEEEDLDEMIPSKFQKSLKSKKSSKSMKRSKEDPMKEDLDLKRKLKIERSKNRKNKLESEEEN